MCSGVMNTCVPTMPCTVIHSVHGRDCRAIEDHQFYKPQVLSEPVAECGASISPGGACLLKEPIQATEQGTHGNRQGRCDAHVVPEQLGGVGKGLAGSPPHTGHHGRAAGPLRGLHQQPVQPQQQRLHQPIDTRVDAFLRRIPLSSTECMCDAMCDSGVALLMDRKCEQSLCTRIDFRQGPNHSGAHMLNASRCWHGNV